MTKQRFPNGLLEDYTKLEFFSKHPFGLSKDALKDNRLALIIVFSSADMILDFLLKEFCKHGSMISDTHTPFMAKVILLNERGVIDEKLFNNLNGLKQLRHLAAHKPTRDIKWKGKFAFNKKSDIYKKFVVDFGEPPKDLVGNIFCVWNDLYVAGRRAYARKYLNKWKTQKTSKNNK